MRKTGRICKHNSLRRGKNPIEISDREKGGIQRSFDRMEQRQVVKKKQEANRDL